MLGFISDDCRVCEYGRFLDQTGGPLLAEENCDVSPLQGYERHASVEQPSDIIFLYRNNVFYYIALLLQLHSFIFGVIVVF